MKLALGWLRKREGWTERGAGRGRLVSQTSRRNSRPLRSALGPLGASTRSRRSCARTTPSVISDWFTDVRGEPCAEPSEGGRPQPLTAESIIARCVSMIISRKGINKSQTKDSTPGGGANPRDLTRPLPFGFTTL